jgi:pimeloyl-ACP methyl ester carboxylesterase
MARAKSDRQLTFVLIHGAFHGGWCWDRVAQRLTALGHRVFAPTLAGLDVSRQSRPSGVTLSTHIHDTVELIERGGLRNIVLCGHSYGGMVISGVAEFLPSSIAALVYLDAVKPAPGECMWDCLPDETRKAFKASTVDGYVAPVSAAAFKVNEADRAWVDARCTPQPIETFLERLPVTNRRASISRNTYVYSEGFASPIMSKFADEAEASGWRRINLPDGHDLMLDCPEEVARILLDASRA